VKEQEAVQSSDARSPELDKLQAFIGKWHAEGKSYGEVQDLQDPKKSAVPWISDETYVWLPGNHFVLHKWEAKTGQKSFIGTEILGYDETKMQFFTRFFDNAGFHPSYDAYLNDEIWHFVEPNTRAKIIINDPDTMTFHWEWKKDGTWLPLCDRIARRVG
jgi:hypothetical protein